MDDAVRRKMKVSGTRWAALLLTGLAIWTWGCRGPKSGIEPVTAQEIESHIRFLSDDLLEGRAVGSKGIGIAENYQEDLFKTFGLEPLFGSSYRQVFSLRGAQPDRSASLEFTSGKVRIVPAIFDDFVVNTEREDRPEEVIGELVYCGYLIQAPERNWDDVKGADLKGKVLLCEINEPGNVPGGIFDGEDMTYYGRWTYKFEKAAELGAAGVLIVHNTKGAAYGWDVVRNSWAKETFFLPDKNPSLYFQGWLNEAAAQAVFSAVKMNREELLAGAETPVFTPVPLGLRVKIRQNPSFRTVSAQNVAGLIRGKGREAKDRYIIISAHFDHLGRDENLAGDQIFNGAVDNCSATASMLALAAYYAQRPEALKANLVFAAVTAEEHVMLGSDHFARHLPFPESSVLADINLEMTNVWGETEDVFAIGARHSDLDEVCRQAAEALGLRYTPERKGELGFFFRSDQVSFARAGIPAVWLHQGIVSKGEDKGFVHRKFEEYRNSRYHKVTDEIGDDWDYRGTLDIIHWAQEIIRLLQERPDPPQFKPDSAFRRKSPASGLVK
jgi:Zn-dependent M28 family amino/carboxypeptidase